MCNQNATRSFLVRPHIEYLNALNERFKVDEFCGYRSRGLQAIDRVDWAMCSIRLG